MRGYVEKGLSIEGSREDIDFIARIIRQEITAVYHVDEIKAIADHDTDRLAKMLMKIGKINGAIFFLLIKVLMNLANEGSEDDFDQMLSEAVKLGVDYMQKRISRSTVSYRIQLICGNWLKIIEKENEP